MFIVVPHLVVYAIFGNNMKGFMSPYLCLFIGIAKLIYYNFDNMDGKQARKTGSSSPLGVLLDHGCDALTCMFQGLNMSIMLQYDCSILVLGAYLVGIVTFFFCTLQTYICESLDLGYLNSANEGLFFLILLYIWTAMQGGNDFWIQTNCLGFQNNYTISVTAYILASFTIVQWLM